MSRVLWDGPTISVVGLPWCKTTPKTVGVDSITAHVLCRTHNTELSDTDRAAGDAFKSLKRAAALELKRTQQRPRKWKVVRYEIDGRRLERWFLKTLINIIVSRQSGPAWAFSGSAFDQPPDLLTRAAFGHQHLAKPLGLYAAAAVGETVIYRDGVELATLLRRADGALVGALFWFLGLRFLLYLDQVEVPPSLPLPSGKGEMLTSDALYHLGRINSRVARKVSHYVHFLWNLP